MATIAPGWYDDGTGTQRWWDGEKWTEQQAAKEPIDGVGGLIDHIKTEANAGAQARPAANGMNYVVLQVVLKEKFLGTASANLTELEAAINNQCALGYRLHTISTSSGGSKGLIGGDRIQATLVFEKLS